MSVKSIDVGMASGVPLRKKKPFRLYLRVLLPSLLVLVFTSSVFIGVLSYRIIHSYSSQEESNPASYLLPYQDLSFAAADGSHSLWFIPGSKGSPAVFLCHDYGANRVSLLNLAALLRESGYNVFLIAFRGHGRSGYARSTLGLKEGDDLAYGINFAVKNLAVHETAVGVWGVALGAHAAIRAALKDNRIRVLVLDSPYSSVFDFLSHQVAERVGFESEILSSIIGGVYSLYLWTSPGAILEAVDVRPLFPVRQMYVAGLDTPAFARWTRRLYAQAEGRKDILILPRSRKSTLLTSELKSYDSRVLDYFQKHLPR